jgi:hypothetical protein
VVGQLGHGRNLGPTCAEQNHKFVLAEASAGAGRVEYIAHRAPRGRPCRQDQLRRYLGARVPRRRTTADLHDLCSGTDVGSGLMTLWPDRAGVVAGQSSGVGTVEDRKARGRIEPAFRPKRELRINGEPRYQRVAVAFGNTAQRVQGRPRAFRIHVVGRDW